MKWFGVMKYRLPLLLRQHKFSDLDRNAFVKLLLKHTNIKGKEEKASHPMLLI